MENFCMLTDDVMVLLIVLTDQMKFNAIVSRFLIGWPIGSCLFDKKCSDEFTNCCEIFKIVHAFTKKPLYYKSHRMWNGRMAYESFEAKHGKYLYYREGSKWNFILDWSDINWILLRLFHSVNSTWLLRAFKSSDSELQSLFVASKLNAHFQRTMKIIKIVILNMRSLRTRRVIFSLRLSLDSTRLLGGRLK